MIHYSRDGILTACGQYVNGLKHTANPGGATCIRCQRSARQEAPSSEWKCRYCGGRNPDGARYCANCNHARA